MNSLYISSYFINLYNKPVYPNFIENLKYTYKIYAYSSISLRFESDTKGG